MVSLRQDAGFRSLENWVKLHWFRPTPARDAGDDEPAFAPAPPPGLGFVAPSLDNNAAPQANEEEEPNGQLLFGPIKTYNYFAAPIGAEGNVSQASGFDIAGLLGFSRQGVGGPRDSQSATAFEEELEGLFGSGDFAAGGAGLLTADFGSLGSHAFLMVDGNGQAGYQPAGDFVFHIGEMPPPDLGAPPVI